MWNSDSSLPEPGTTPTGNRQRECYHDTVPLVILRKSPCGVSRKGAAAPSPIPGDTNRVDPTTTPAAHANAQSPQRGAMDQLPPEGRQVLLAGIRIRAGVETKFVNVRQNM